MTQQPEEKSLVERLKQDAEDWQTAPPNRRRLDVAALEREAADRIEELERQVEYGVRIKYVGRSKPPVVTDDD